MELLEWAAHTAVLLGLRTGPLRRMPVQSVH